MTIRYLLSFIFLWGSAGSIHAAVVPVERAWLNRDDGSQVRYVASNAPIYCREEMVFPQRVEFEESVMNNFLLEDWRHTHLLSRNFLSAEVFIRFQEGATRRTRVISQAICIDTKRGDLCLRGSAARSQKACFVSSAPHPSTEELMKRLGFEALITDDKDGGMHSEEGLISGLLENIHLYTDCVPSREERRRIYVQGIGLRAYSAYDSCDGCLQDLCDMRSELVRSFRRRGGFSNISPTLTCDIVFHSYRPYTRDGRSDEDDRMARYHLWLAGGRPRVIIHSIRPHYPILEEGAPTALIEGQAAYQLQFNQRGEIGTWQIPFSCMTLDTYGFNWQAIRAVVPFKAEVPRLPLGFGRSPVRGAAAAAAFSAEGSSPSALSRKRPRSPTEDRLLPQPLPSTERVAPPGAPAEGISRTVITFRGAKGRGGAPASQLSLSAPVSSPAGL